VQDIQQKESGRGNAGQVQSQADLEVFLVKVESLVLVCKVKKIPSFLQVPIRGPIPDLIKRVENHMNAGVDVCAKHRRVKNMYTKKGAWGAQSSSRLEC
jgi:hypothetical protein